MAIENIQIAVADVPRSLAFYQKYLHGKLVGQPSEERAVLDFLTATIELIHAPGAGASQWIPDDLQRGARHLGFKVADLDSLLAVIKEDEVPIRLDALEAEGGVRIAFFYDPDGVSLEFVQRDLDYTRVEDADLVAAEMALGIPERPRFDHVAITADDFATTEQHYCRYGFGHSGMIAQPWDDRGYEINFLRSGDTALEIFTYEAPTVARAVELDSLGLRAIRLSGDPVDTPIGQVEGAAAFADPDGFIYTLATPARGPQ